MRVGTKSVLFGAHCFLLHPWFVAWAWWKLYGFPWDPRLWVAFFIHDLGYWGSPNMDGPEGERHPEWGALVMARLFDRGRRAWTITGHGDHLLNVGRWGHFVLYHSRFYSKAAGVRPSRLCFADKLAICLTPWWLYLPMVKATGEIHDYMHDNPREIKGEGRTPKQWYLDVQTFVRAWVDEHRDGREDTWTPAAEVPHA